MTIGLIIARGGSKRIPKKNIKNFHGKPIISYSIEAAKKSGIFERIIVSTDSREIAAVANDYGAETPFIRPDDISDDLSTTASVISHAIDWLSIKKEEPENICCIYATAPFLQSEYLIEGYNNIINENCTSSFAVTTYSFPIQRSLEITQDGYIRMVFPENELTRSQDLIERY